MQRNLIWVFTLLLAATLSFARARQSGNVDSTTAKATPKVKRTGVARYASRGVSIHDRNKLTPSSSNSAASPAPATTAPATARRARAVEPSQASGGDRMDLNSASESQLAALSGVGAAKAAKIVAMRPYAGKNQLVSKGILSAEEYAAIKDQIIAHHVKK